MAMISSTGQQETQLRGKHINCDCYSIDEAFLNLAGIGEELTEYGRQIRKTVKQWTGIPVSIGIAKTKTLAKVAGRIAKKSEKANGVLDLTESKWLEKALSQVKVADIWGGWSKDLAKTSQSGDSDGTAVTEYGYRLGPEHVQH